MNKIDDAKDIVTKNYPNSEHSTKRTEAFTISSYTEISQAT
jgi:hypothetical protein